MAFVLEGSTTANIVDGAGDTDVSIPGTPVEDDIVFYGQASDAVVTDGTDECVQTAGYTNIKTDTAETSPGHASGYKIMGATPDSVITFNQTGSTERVATIVQTWSGEDTTTPEDVTPTNTSGGSGMPNSPSITPVTDGALVIAFGFLDDDNIAASVTAPSGYSNLTAHDNSAVGDNASVMMASIVVNPAAAEDPAAFGGTGDDAWISATFALRPAPAADTSATEFAATVRSIMPMMPPIGVVGY